MTLRKVALFIVLAVVASMVSHEFYQRRQKDPDTPNSRESQPLTRSIGGAMSAPSSDTNSTQLPPHRSRPQRSSATSAGKETSDTFNALATDGFVRLELDPESILLDALSLIPRIAFDDDSRESVTWEASRTPLLDGTSFSVAPGEWTVVGIAKSGILSEPVEIEVQPEVESTAIIRVTAGCQVSGLVYDAISGLSISGGVVEIAAYGSLESERFRTAGIPSAALRHQADNEGRFSVLLSLEQDVTLKVSADGYRYEYVTVTATDDLTVAIEDVGLYAVDVMQVRLVNGRDSDYTGYKLAIGRSNRFSYPDAAGYALVEYEEYSEIVLLAIHLPNGTSIRRDVPRHVAEAGVVEVDVGGNAKIRVVLDGEMDLAGTDELWVTANAMSASGECSYWSARIVDREAELIVSESGPTTVALRKHNPTEDFWFRRAVVEPKEGEVVDVEFDVGTRLHSLVVLDHVDRPVKHANLTLGFSDDQSSWHGCSSTGEIGRMIVPDLHAQEISLEGRVGEDVYIIDYRVRPSMDDEGRFVVRLGLPEPYEIVLQHQGRALAWRPVVIRGEGDHSWALPAQTEANGAIDWLVIVAGSAPYCVIRDKQLFEYGAEFPLRAGRNLIEVTEIATLELECREHLDPRGVELVSVEQPAEFAEWLSTGRVSRTELPAQRRTIIRYAPIPLGKYRWILDSGRSGDVRVEQAGKTTTAIL